MRVNSTCAHQVRPPVCDGADREQACPRKRIRGGSHVAKHSAACGELIGGRSALESENTGYPSTGLNNVGQPCRPLRPAFRTRRSSPLARKLESLPTCSVGPREMAAANMIPRT